MRSSDAAERATDSRSASQPVFAFGDFELDEGRLELLCNGAAVELHPKPLRLLLYLLHHRDRAVSKDELLDRVWADVVVSETAISSAVKDLRRALGDDGVHQRTIQTLRGRGYRFVAAVEERISRGSESAAASASEQRPVLPLEHVAVLPFKSLSSDPENEYLADGISEDIVTHISKIPHLRVVSSTSSSRYKGSQKSLNQIAGELRVGSVVEGSVRRDGDRLRISAQLIEAARDLHLWAEAYDERLDDVFRIQQDVARQVAAALRIELSSADLRSLARRPTERITAYDYYLRGRDHYRRCTREANENAVEFYQRALSIDPDFALAWAGLANANGLRAGNFGLGAEYNDRAIEYAEKALVLDPSLPEGHKALGVAFMVKGWLQRSLESHLKAVELRPGFDEAVHNISCIHCMRGEFDEGLRWLRGRLLSDADSPHIPVTNLGSILRNLELFEEARDCLEQLLARSPLDRYANLQLALLEIATGDRDAARHRLTRILGVHRRDSHCLYEMAALEMLEGNHTRAAKLCQQLLDVEERGEETREMPARRLLAVCLMRSGDAEGAEEQLRTIEADNREGIEQGDERWSPAWELAVVAALRGRRDEALDCYERAYEAGRRDFRWDEIEPAFASLRDDPRFRAQLDRMRASIEEMRERAVREGWHRFDSF